MHTYLQLDYIVSVHETNWVRVLGVDETMDLLEMPKKESLPGEAVLPSPDLP